MTEIRLDRVEAPKVKKTKEGYLKGKAVITRVGVFHYKNLDGSDRFELRHPDEVFKAESLDSAKSIPITINHPNVLVNAKNIDELSKGFTGENIQVVDQTKIVAPINITHFDAAEQISKGSKMELSLGYELNVVREDGVYEGQAYTHKQSNIIYNHLAIVERGRAGRDARVNLDSNNLYGMNALKEYRADEQDENQDCKMNSELNKVLKQLRKAEERIDEEVDVEEKEVELKKEAEPKKETLDLKKPEAPAENSKLNELREGVEQEISALQDKLKALNSEIDKKQAELKTLKTEHKDHDIPAMVDERVARVINLITKSSKVVNADSLIGLSEKKIMETVIRTKEENFDSEAHSDEYVRGKYDSIINLAPNYDAIKAQMQKIQTPYINNDSAEIYKRNPYKNENVVSILNSQQIKHKGN